MEQWLSGGLHPAEDEGLVAYGHLAMCQEPYLRDRMEFSGVQRTYMRTQIVRRSSVPFPASPPISSFPGLFAISELVLVPEGGDIRRKDKLQETLPRFFQNPESLGSHSGQKRSE